MSATPKEIRWLVGGMSGEPTLSRTGTTRVDSLNCLVADLAQPGSLANRYLDALRVFAEEAWSIHWAAIFEESRQPQDGQGSLGGQEVSTACVAQLPDKHPGNNTIRAAAWLSAPLNDSDASGNLLLTVRDALAELLSDGSLPPDLSNRLLVNLLRDRLFGDQPMMKERLRRFYDTAAVAVSYLIVQRAERRLTQQSESDLETALAKQETTFAIAERAPLATLARDRALERLAAAAPRLAEIYRLVTFAGRNSQEIADLVQASPPDVEADFETAAVEVYLDEL